MKGVQTVFSFEMLFLYYVATLLTAVPTADAFQYVPTTTTTYTPTTNNMRTTSPLQTHQLHPQKQYPPARPHNPRSGCTTDLRRRNLKLYAFPLQFLKNKQGRLTSILHLRKRTKRSPPSPSGDVLGSLRRKHGVLRRRKRWISRMSEQPTTPNTPDYLTSLNNNGTDDSLKAVLREDEEFVMAVKEVKGAAQNVTSSAGEFTKKIVTNGPNIIKRFSSAFVSKEMREDLVQRKQYYKSDWLDAFSHKRQCVPAILFLYFACLAPVVSFGTISSQITEGAIGVMEFFLASGTAGMVRYSNHPHWISTHHHVYSRIFLHHCLSSSHIHTPKQLMNRLTQYSADSQWLS